MTAPAFFAPDVSGERVVLTGEEARHAVRSLRVRPGERIRVVDGRGAWVEATVTEAGAELAADVIDRGRETPPRPRLEVYQGIPTSRKLDVVVAKLTELGASRITAFAAARSVALWDDRKARTQAERLRAVALGAAKQSRRAWLPEVSAPVRFEELELPEPCFVLHEEAAGRLSPALPPDPPERLGLVVGPEGGLASAEVSALAKRGGIPVSLGPAVLRTETAALVAASIVLSRYGELG